MDKIELRKKSLLARKELKNKKNKSLVIVNKIVNEEHFKKSKIVGLYYPKKDEVDIKDLIIIALKEKKVVCLPRVISNEEMCFIKINSIEEVELGNFDIYEPKYNEGNIINKFSIDLFIVPGVSFDESNNRLGYGKGYYDRYLVNVNGYKIGITFKELFLKKDTIIAGLKDVKMDKIIVD